MNKSLHRNDSQTTPFIAINSWELSNVKNENLILTEHSGSPIALEFFDYEFDGTPVTNSSCNIASEHQDSDRLSIREGKKQTGLFYETEEKNQDGTFKRIVYSQVSEMFYNKHRDPTKIWGMDKIDFDLSKSKRFISDRFFLYNIPRSILSEKIMENTVRVVDSMTDSDLTIRDDGNGNLFVSESLFSRRQEVGVFSNTFYTGSNNICTPQFGWYVPPTPSINLEVHWNGVDEIILTWENTSDFITEIKIYKNKWGDSGFSLLDTIPGADTEYIDTSIDDSSIYYVVAVNHGGESGPSNEVSFNI